MDKRIAIWNVLHDGEITAISDEAGDTLTMFVSIPYLRRRLAPLGDSFVITLSGVSRIGFRNFDGTVTSLKDEIETGTPEILSTDSEAMPLEIMTTMGTLLLEFRDIAFALDSGQAIDYESIERVCREYWTEWKERAEQRRGAGRG